MRRLILTALCLCWASTVVAQTPAVGTEILTWDQAGATLVAVQGYVYDVQDGTTAPARLTPVTCTGTATPFVCGSRLPALTTGLHSLTVTARTTVNGTQLSSSPSAPLALLIMAMPATPQNLRLTTP